MSGDLEDIAALRQDGDLATYLLSLTEGPAERDDKPATETPEAEEPDYVIPHRGAWPIGSAPSGPTPMHGNCTCPTCARKESA